MRPLAFVLMFSCAAVGVAQTTETVDVVLACENAPETITVVLDGHEDDPIFATRVAGTNHWRGARGEDRSFDANGRVASVRLGGARTGCARSRPQRLRGADEWVAQFSLTCSSQKYWRALQVDATPLSVPMSYARVMSGTPPCRDTHSNITGTVVISSLAPYKEKIHLHVGEPPRSIEEYLLHIEPGPWMDERGSKVILRSKTLIDNFALRSRNGGNQRDIERRDLDKIGFKKLTLTKVE
jgi:hypothetical protein